MFCRKSIADIRKQSDLTGTLDSYGEFSLMRGAGTGNSAGKDLCSLGNIAAKSSGILVVDKFSFGYTEGANLLAAFSVHGAGALVIFFIESHYNYPPIVF